MTPITRIVGERGEIQLPPSVLQELGIGPRDRVEIAVVDGEVRIAPSPEHERHGQVDPDRRARLRAAFGSISRAFEHETVEEAEAAVAKAIAEVRAEDDVRGIAPSSRQ